MKTVVPFVIVAILVAEMIGQAGPSRAQSSVLGGHVSALAVDCLWTAAPESFKQAISNAPTQSAALQAMNDWNPSNTKLTSLAKQCGIANGPSRVAGEVATLAYAGKTLETWGLSRLKSITNLGEADLDRGWMQVGTESRQAMARHFPKTGKEPEPQSATDGFRAMWAELHVNSQPVAMAIAYYAVGRALLETLETDD